MCGHSSSGVSDQQSVGPNPGLDTYVKCTGPDSSSGVSDKQSKGLSPHLTPVSF